MSHEEAIGKQGPIVTEQIVINKRYSSHLIPVTAYKTSIDEINGHIESLHVTIRECISLLSVSGENTKAIVAEKLKGLIE